MNSDIICQVLILAQFYLILRATLLVRISYLLYYCQYSYFSLNSGIFNQKIGSESGKLLAVGCFFPSEGDKIWDSVFCPPLPPIWPPLPRSYSRGAGHDVLNDLYHGAVGELVAEAERAVDEGALDAGADDVRGGGQRRHQHDAAAHAEQHGHAVHQVGLVHGALAEQDAQTGHDAQTGADAQRDLTAGEGGGAVCQSGWNIMAQIVVCSKLCQGS